ncbi:hypothetical protein CHU98_g9744 [Xylaria longipes]|nr:hypothetical protein CHU98_g9744 [Xylaria longipes]
MGGLLTYLISLEKDEDTTKLVESYVKVLAKALKAERASSSDASASEDSASLELKDPMKRQKMDWYSALTEHLLDENKIVEPSEPVLKELEMTIVTLYKALLLYQMKSACYYHNRGLTLAESDSGDYPIIVLFSPDGSNLVSGSIHNTIRVWDIATGRVERVLRGNSRSMTADIFEADSEIIGQTISRAGGQPLYSVDETRHWVTRNGRNFLYLPPEH